MKAVQHDFNYKVALASGLKNLQAGKLPQAEEQFRYLVSKFPTADGGYRGLARVLMSRDDTAAAVTTLRDGAAVLAKAGERVVAIDLLRECTTLDPLDLVSHRRLAAALALAGDVSAAAQEYVRFTRTLLDAGNGDRARMEASYALETFGEIPALHELARQLGIQLRTVRGAGGRTAAAGDVASEGSHPASTLAPAGATDDGAPSRTAPADGASWREIAQPSSTSPAAAPVMSPSEAPAEVTAIAPAGGPEALGGVPDPEPPVPPADPFVLEARAMALIGARDAEAGGAAIDATRALIAAGKVQAASDLLLELIASGISVHDAERELIGVAQALGRDDIAEERSRLLSEAARLG